MNWQQVAAQLAQMGLPYLGQLLVGQIPIVGAFLGPTGGRQAGELVAKAIALALGVEPTPDAVSTAIEKGDTTEVVAKLKAIETEAAARWPAEAEINKADDQAAVDMARLSEDAYVNRIRADVATNGPWLSAYRPILNYAATFNIIYFGGFIAYAVTIGGPIAERLVAASDLLKWWVGFLAALVGAHFFTRAQERKAAVSIPNTTTTSTVRTTTGKR